MTDERISSSLFLFSLRPVSCGFGQHDTLKLSFGFYYSCARSAVLFLLFSQFICSPFIIAAAFFMILILFLLFLTFLFKALEPVQTELKDEDALPKLLVVGIALIGLGLLIANTALVAWFIIRKKIKGKRKRAN
jgi:hypothetical protein